MPPVRPDVKRLPGTPILMGDGETIWRTYKAVQLRTRQHGEGTPHGPVLRVSGRFLNSVILAAKLTKSNQEFRVMHEP